MRPFSAFSYIKRNRTRAVCIILMLACTAIAFIGGMYVDNIRDAHLYAFEDPSEYALWYRSGNNNDIYNEYAMMFLEHKKMLPESAKTSLQAQIRFVEYKSIMGFNNEIPAVFLTSKDDFDTFVRLTDKLPKDTAVDKNELIISEMLANNWGVKEGDIIKRDGSFEFFIPPADMVIKMVLPMKGYQIYGWIETDNQNGGIILPTFEKHYDTLASDLNSFRKAVLEKYPHIKVFTNESVTATITEQTAMLTYFFYAVVAVVALVFAITLNATFAAMYDKRKYEFSIYKAIGISKAKIFKKILSEVLVMDTAGLIIGGLLCVIAIFILNEILWSSGLRFIHISLSGVIGTIACNIAIIIPVVWANMKRIRKYDVTIY